jgi:hypothetical protein
MDAMIAITATTTIASTSVKPAACRNRGVDVPMLLFLHSN